MFDRTGISFDGGIHYTNSNAIPLGFGSYPVSLRRRRPLQQIVSSSNLKFLYSQ